ncbi:hypothetical protein DACRYDRAFT_106580, partial [Dacryopinax primogenitus]
MSWGYRVITVTAAVPYFEPTEIIGDPKEISLQLDAVVSAPLSIEEREGVTAHPSASSVSRRSVSNSLLYRTFTHDPSESACQNLHDENASTDCPNDVDAPLKPATTQAGPTNEETLGREGKGKEKPETGPRHLGWSGIGPAKTPLLSSIGSSVNQFLTDHPSLSFLAALEDKSKVNILGVILQVGKLVTKPIAMRSASVALDGSTQQASTKQKSRMLCEVQVVDKEGHVVRVTMWNSRAKIFSGKHGQVLHVMNSVVEHRGGVTLNSSEKTEFPLNPKIEEADELKQWFTDGFDEAALKHISCGYSKEGGLTSTTLEELPKVLTKAQVRASRLGHGDCIDYFNM